MSSPNALPFQNLYLREADFVETSLFPTLRSQPLGIVDIGRRRCYHEIADPLAAVCAVLVFEPDDALAFRLQSIELSEGAEWAQYAIEPSAWGEDIGGIDKVLFIQRGGQLYWGEVMRLDDPAGDARAILATAATTLRQRTVCLLLSDAAVVRTMESDLGELGFESHGEWDARRRHSVRFAEGIEEIDSPHVLTVFLKTKPARPLARRSRHALCAAALLLDRPQVALEAAADEDRERVERLLARFASAA